VISLNKLKILEKTTDWFNSVSLCAQIWHTSRILIAWASSYSLLCRNVSRGKCWATIRLSHHLEQGWAINLARIHFQKAAFSRGPHLLMEIEASIGWVTTLEEISDLNIFPECIRGPHLARGPLFAHPWSRTVRQSINHGEVGNLGEKSVYIHLAVLAGVPCPLKITLQCSADKKVWEALS